MICKECGAELSDSAKFCNSCGAKVLAQPIAEPVSAPADAPAFDPYEQSASPFGETLPPPSAVFPPAPEAEEISEAPEDAPEPPPAAPREEVPEGPVRIRTGAGSLGLGILLCAALLVLPLLLFYHAMAAAGGAGPLDLLSSDAADIAASVWPLLGLAALIVVLVLDLWLLNYRRVRRAFLTVGLANLAAGLAVGVLGALLPTVAKALPGALGELLLATPNALRDLLLLFALGDLALGAVCLSVFACIQICRRGVPAKTAKRPLGVKLLLLILNVLLLLFLIACAFLYLRAAVQ